jgi:LysR family nitrogen assimilation transcriptional regulator
MPFRHHREIGLQMELRELRYFKTVAELQNFSKAALQLRIAQPALSRQIRKLEDELGVELFIRHGRGVHLTESGEVLLISSQRLINQLRQMRDEVMCSAEVATGHVGIGVPPSAGKLLIPPLFESYRKLCPNVSLYAAEGLSGQLLDILISGKADVVVMYNPTATADLAVVPLLVEEMYLVGPPEGRQAKLPPITLAEVAKLPLVLTSEAHSWRESIGAAFAQQGLRVNPVVEVDGLILQKGLVQAGFGYAILKYGACAEELAMGALSARPIVSPVIDWTLSMVMRRDLRPNLAVTQLISLLQQQTHQLVENGTWKAKSLVKPPSLSRITKKHLRSRLSKVV